MVGEKTLNLYVFSNVFGCLKEKECFTRKGKRVPLAKMVLSKVEGKGKVCLAQKKKKASWGGGGRGLRALELFRGHIFLTVHRGKGDAVAREQFST